MFVVLMLLAVGLIEINLSEFDE